MFRPVGDLPPSVYWRRRFAFGASVLALVVLSALTFRVLTSDSSSGAAAPTGTSTSPRPSHSASPQPSTPHTSHSTTAPTPARSSAGSSGSSSPSSSAPPKPCEASQLSLSAESDKTSYAVGEQPVLSILVKNDSTSACVQDLADPQIILRVYNGESRVWGSHDCKIEPGTDDRTLMPASSVRVSIVWSGLSSQPNNCSNRQRAGAGTYTLYASLSGREGKAAQFTIR